MKKNNPLSRNPRAVRIAALAVLAITLLAVVYVVYVSGNGPDTYVPGSDSESYLPGPTGDRAEDRADSPAERAPAGTTGAIVPAPELDESVGARDPGASDRDPGASVRDPGASDRPGQPGGHTTGETTWSPAAATAAAATASGGDAGGAQPRYAVACRQFLARVDAIQAAMRDDRFYLGVYEVDAANPTLMLVLSDTKARADNLDGYFRLAIDRDGETWGHAPLAIGLNSLFTLSGRDRAYADGKFCADGLDDLLAATLQAALAERYDPGILTFILEEYRTGMELRWQGGGIGRTAYRAVAPFPALDVVFNDGFVTYVEFFPDPSPAKA